MRQAMSYDDWKCTDPADNTLGEKVADHTHPCCTCGQKVECNGTWERNDDGWPEAVCDFFHLERNCIVNCEACEEKQQAAYERDIAEQDADDAKELADPRRV